MGRRCRRGAPIQVWIEVHCLGCLPSPDRSCPDCLLPSMLDVAWAYVDQATLRIVGHSMTRWCPDCGSTAVLDLRGSS